MTFSPGDVVRLKCGGPAMVIGQVRQRPYDDFLCLWIVHTSVAREWFVEEVLERVVASAPAATPADREMALNLWAVGASIGEIAALAGYASADVVKQVVFKARKTGDPRAMLRRRGRKAAEVSEDPLYRMEP